MLIYHYIMFWFQAALYVSKKGNVDGCVCCSVATWVKQCKAVLVPVREAGGECVRAKVR